MQVALMPIPVDALKPAIARILSLWERDLLSPQQALTGLLYHLFFTLYESPGSRREVADILHMLPAQIAFELAEHTNQKRTPDGDWEWPPMGGIGSSGGTKFRKASVTESAVYESLSGWLRGRASGEPF